LPEVNGDLDEDIFRVFDSSPHVYGDDKGCNGKRDDWVTEMNKRGLAKTLVNQENDRGDQQRSV
jgi:hypothetical protein